MREGVYSGTITTGQPHHLPAKELVVKLALGANYAMQNWDTQIALASSSSYWGHYYISANQKGCYTNCHGDNHNGRQY